MRLAIVCEERRESCANNEHHGKAKADCDGLNQVPVNFLFHSHFLVNEKSTGFPVLFPTIYLGVLVLVLGLCEFFAVLGALDASDGEDH